RDNLRNVHYRKVGGYGTKNPAELCSLSSDAFDEKYIATFLELTSQIDGLGVGIQESMLVHQNISTLRVLTVSGKKHANPIVSRAGFVTVVESNPDGLIQELRRNHYLGSEFLDFARTGG